jgi:hypothetical protein
MIDAMKKGLEALQGSGYYDTTQQREAITALRQAIAEAEKQEPVAVVEVLPLRMDEWIPEVKINWANKPVAGPLYTAPRKREWVGLAWEEIRDIWIANYHDTDATDAFAYAIEAKLKERNT